MSLTKITQYISKSCLKNSLRFYCSTNATNATHSSNKKIDKFYGQPTHFTHPHLINEGEVLGGIKLSEFKNRRIKLMESILQQSKENKGTTHLVVIPSATKSFISEKIPHVFRQNSDMLYLSGCLEPDTILVLIGSSPDSFETTLFLRENDPHSLLWDGPRTGTQEAIPFFGVDKALPIEEFRRYIENFIKTCNSRQIWYDVFNPIQPHAHKVIRNHIDNTQLVSSPRPLIHRLRVLKSPSEAQLMRATCRIGSEAIASAMAFTHPGCSEHQLFACVDYECRVRGAERLGYPPVVAAGPRATIIHYIEDNQLIANGDLVLMDAGCEYRGYTSDITRTWPVSGRFSSYQKTLYEVVLHVQKLLIKKLNNLPSLDFLYKEMLYLLGKYLQESSILSKKLSSEELTETVSKLCPHHVSHYLGMDVHDTAAISRAIPLHPGMVITVEPGIYITPQHTCVPREFHNIGIRIEDDIYIAPNRIPEILTAKCPKEVEEIENAMIDAH